MQVSVVVVHAAEAFAGAARDLQDLCALLEGHTRAVHPRVDVDEHSDLRVDRLDGCRILAQDREAHSGVEARDARQALERRADERVRHEDVGAIEALTLQHLGQEVRLARRRALELLDPGPRQLRPHLRDLRRLDVRPPAVRPADVRDDSAHVLANEVEIDDERGREGALQQRFRERVVGHLEVGEAVHGGYYDGVPAPNRAMRLALLLPFVPTAAASVASSQDEASEAAGLAFFENRIRPLVAGSCTECHGPEKQKSGLRLDSREAMIVGGERGPAIAPGDVEGSLLLRAVSYTDEDLRMPPRTRLEPRQIADLTRWIEMGAPAPRGPATAGAPREEFDLEARKAHWCFQPVADPAPPAVADGAWPRDPLDRFVLRRIEEAGLVPAPEADRATWIRRVTFDLTGLPPTPPEVQAFLLDASEGAFERVVDRLLASPHFGERWARHWLDLVGYAETRGHEFDHVLPNAWHYRDYLIRAFNADLPYDRLVTEHIAGDLLAEPRLHSEEGSNESILATGFWWLGEEVHSPVSTRADECDRFAGRVDVIGRTFLGLTVACARCHDHKFDPITAADFHALVGFQQSAAYRQVRFETMQHNALVAGALAELAAERRLELMGGAAARLAAEVESMDGMLLAARDVLVRQTPGQRADGVIPADAVARVAHERVLPPELVESWAHEVFEARGDPLAPLHAWALGVAGWRTRPARAVRSPRPSPGSKKRRPPASGARPRRSTTWRSWWTSAAGPAIG